MSSRFVRLLAAPVGLVATCAAAAVLAGGMAASAAPVAASGGSWLPARELPGIGSLNKGGTSAPLALVTVPTTSRRSSLTLTTAAGKRRNPSLA
ncbi:MAG TPA: hypothetical protein VFI65_13120 [Streptosporangiaceae bacterium]|nr:hypothetical protein [Streptosporangiaceae bacterium]